MKRNIHPDSAGCYTPYRGSAQIADDGTVFVPADYYNVASANLGVLRINPDGTRVTYKDRLYANVHIVESVCREYMEAYNRTIKK